MNKISQKISDSSRSSHQSIKALCNQSPFLIINTPCGVGRYKFNRIGYNNKDEIVLEYKLINDDNYGDTENIAYNIGNMCFLTASQYLYAFEYQAYA